LRPVRRIARPLHAGALALVAIAAPAPVRADPQASVGLTSGAAIRGSDPAGFRTVDFHLGARGDLMFLRKAPRDFGLGPYATVSTHAFDEIAWGGGLALLFPITEITPLVLGGGAYGRVGNDPFGVEGGVSTSVFFGARSYNFHSSYELSAGLLVEGRIGLGPSQERTLVIALQVDVVAFALPFIMLAGAAQRSKETRPVGP